MKTMRIWWLACVLVSVAAIGCGGEEAPATPAAAAPEQAEQAEQAAPSGGGRCEDTATATDTECHSCCVARGAAGNSWMGGDHPVCRCIGG